MTASLHGLPLAFFGGSVGSRRARERVVLAGLTFMVGLVPTGHALRAQDDDAGVPETQLEPDPPTVDAAPPPSAAVTVVPSQAFEAEEPGAPTSATSAVVEAQSTTVSARGNVDWITAARGVLFPKTGPDPPRLVGGQTELRPNLRLEIAPELQAVAQLRVGFEGSSTSDGMDWSRVNRSLIARITQLYAMWRFNDHFALTFGYQSFQWGPAELITPSNRMFRVINWLRDPLFLVYGRGLVRANISIGKSLSAVVLAEIVPNGDPAFTHGDRFEPNGMLKVEYSTGDGAAYIGVTAGASQSSRGWFGEYASWSMTDNFSVYADASHTIGSHAWYPVQDGASGLPSFQRTLGRSRRVRTLAIFGARYNFDNGVDLRCEYLQNDAGYTKDDMELAAVVASAFPTQPELRGPYTYPGYEILARRLLYGSLRIPDLPPDARVTLQLRYLISLSDRSGGGVLNLMINIQDSYTLFLSGLVTHGPNYGEFSRAAIGYLVLGLVVSL